VKILSETLEVSRSNLVQTLQTDGKAKPGDSRRPDQYRKDTSDVELLPRIRSICSERGTYGYRRVTALLNRALLAENEAKVNHKRIYRIMKQHGLLLGRYGKKPTRTHDGKIITLHPNTRWCSDSFVIRCWNGERVEVAFSMDTCDREAMRYVATNAAITGEMIRDLMAETLEYRFGSVGRLPHSVQWLSDNGPPYTAHETRRFGEQIGLVVCTTPSYSPESNGMSEAFVKTFKRDYVYVSRLESAEAVFKQLPGWFEDYNEQAPHQGLGMRSPREYRRALTLN
jgi:transposase InsO family protein